MAINTINKYSKPSHKGGGHTMAKGNPNSLTWLRRKALRKWVVCEEEKKEFKPKTL